MARNRGGTESIQRKMKALEVAKTDLPVVLGNQTVTYFKNSFRKQGWEDEGLQRWRKRKNQKLLGGIAVINKKSESGRAILVKSGNLRASIILEVANFGKIRVVSNLPYSAIHNEGGTINHPGGTPYIVEKAGVLFLKKDGNYPHGTRFTGPHKIPIPKRKFMGRSRVLRNMHLDKITSKINTAMRA